MELKEKYFFREELSNLNQPRIISLKRLIEVTNLNMDRERFVWSKMWNNVNDLFSEFGCHSNKKIALFIIESLKQLALKFSKVFLNFSQ